MTEPILHIGDRIIGASPCLVIAEAGFNHNGSIEIAKSMIDAAKRSGADAIKFQSYTCSEFLHESVTYAHLFEIARLDENAHAELRDHARRTGIAFGSTPLDPRWVKVLADLDADFLKLASMDVTTPAMLAACASTGLPTILSTGLSTLDEVESAVGCFRNAGGARLALMHCLSLYPAPEDRVNLRAMATMKEAFGVPVGFSDHTTGDVVPVLAVAAGASIIEKHFTLDRDMPGPDQKLSMDPTDFARMVAAIRGAEASLGTGAKIPDEGEVPSRAGTRRGLALRRAMKAGEKVAVSDLRQVRPVIEPDGMRADELRETMTLRKDLPAGHLVKRGDVSA